MQRGDYAATSGRERKCGHANRLISIGIAVGDAASGEAGGGESRHGSVEHLTNRAQPGRAVASRAT